MASPTPTPPQCSWPNCDCGGAQGIVEVCPKYEDMETLDDDESEDTNVEDSYAR